MATTTVLMTVDRGETTYDVEVECAVYPGHDGIAMGGATEYSEAPLATDAEVLDCSVVAVYTEDGEIPAANHRVRLNDYEEREAEGLAVESWLDDQRDL
jgi:hypothetical protein